MKTRLIGVWILSVVALAPGATWYVDDSAPAGGSGTSWSTAFNTLQAALTAAANNDEIRVGQGTYKPAGPGGARSNTFTVNKNLTILGGYLGYPQVSCCPDSFSTDPNSTILSGDLNGDDGTNFANNGENSYRVVTVTSPATSVTIARFSIRSGNTTGGVTTGAGLLVASSAITVKVDRCDFRFNNASSYGGAVDHNGSINSIYSRCIFYANRAQTYGGGMSLSSGNGARVYNCGFYSNKLTATIAGTGGGALWINGTSSIYNCVFSANNADAAVPATPQGGGGAIATGSGTIAISNCTLFANYAPNGRGLLVNSAVPTITNSIFLDDYTTNEISGTANVSYCAGFYGTLAGTGNIAVYNESTLWSNYLGGDGVLGTPDDNFALRRGYPGAAVIDMGTAAGVFADVADLDADGNTSEGTPIDFAGISRRYSDPLMPDAVGAGTPPVDIGAYEANVPSSETLGSVVYVTPDGYGDIYFSPGSGWNSPLGIPQNAFYLAQTFPSVVQEIRFAGGVYRASNDRYLGGTIYGRSASLLIRGGFAGPAFANPDARDIHAFATIFDGDRNNNDPPIVTDPLIPERFDNAVMTWWLDACSGITVDGFRFRNANSGGGASAIFNDSTGTVVRSVIVERSLDQLGAYTNGYNNTSAFMTMVNCDVVNCWGDLVGAVRAEGGTLNMVNCRLLGNRCLATSSSPYQEDTAGAIGINAGAAVFAANCLLASNRGIKGGAVGGEGAITLTNCTVTNNVATGTGGGVWKAGSAPVINNCIFHANTAPTHSQVFPAGTVIFNSLVQGGWAGATNRDGDPGFFSPFGSDGIAGTFDDDYRLLPSSAAIDIGSAALLPTDFGDLDNDGITIELLPLDLALTTRSTDGDLNGTATPDAGCYEFAVGSIINTSTGQTFPTIASAIASASSGHGIAAISTAFTSEPSINFNGKALSLTSTAGITQSAGGLYTLADGALLSTATAGAQTMSLSGELRVPTAASATAAGSTVSLASAGRINVLTGATLNLNAGTLSGSGTATLFPGSSLLLTGSATIPGVAYAQASSTLSTGGSLTLSGQGTLLSASVIAGGGATISGNTNWTGTTFSVPSLSISATGRFTGSGNIYGGISNSGRVYTIGNSVFVGNLTNNVGGIITVQIGTATLIGTLVNNGTINGVLSNPPLPPPGPGAGEADIAFHRTLMQNLGGSDRTAQGDGMFIRGDYIAGAAASLSLPDPVWRLSVAGSYDSAINSSSSYDMRRAELAMARPDTGVSAIEAMSLDRGAVNAGLDRTLPASFPVGTLRIGAGASVSTTDAHDNALDGQSSCEAVYCENLVIESGAVLTALSCRVYYRTLTNQGVIATPANVVRIPPPCGGADLNSDGFVNTTDLTLLLLRFGQLAPPGSPAAIADINADGVVNTSDLTLLLLQFGRTCS